MKSKRLAIIGSQQLGIQLKNLAEQSSNYKFVGFFDDFNTGVNIIGTTKEIEKHYKKSFDEIIIGIGYKHLELKDSIFLSLKEQIPFATIIHPTAIVDSSAIIYPGTVVYPGCIIDKNVIIESNNLLNLGCIISHDTVCGRTNYISPGVVISGFVKIGCGNFIGSNCTIIDSIIIGNKNVIGSASNIISNINNNSKVIGNPAKIIV